MARHKPTPVGRLTLDDPAHVQALRDLATVPESWALVSPGVTNALVIPTAKIEALGGSLDDLFVAILGSLAMLRHPRNRNLSRQMTALEHVNLSLDVTLEDRHNDNATLGAKTRRTNTTNAKLAAKVRGAVGDANVSRMSAAYRRRHPYDRGQHSTRALAAYLARELERNENGVRAALKRLGIK